MSYRKIIHIDMDAFYASVEQRDFPEYRGKPIAVGGASDRGVVAAASYEARKYGVHSAMASKIAAQRCPGLIFVKHRFDVYREVSRQIREIFHAYTDLVEPLSLDEAYLDVSTNKVNLPSATLIAEEIRKRIQEETRLTASAGVSYNKFLAKIASDINKPDGLKVILPEEAEAFLEKLPIRKFHGIGKVTAAKMKKMGIFRGIDLKRYKQDQLVKYFGKSGSYYYNIVRGKDNREVKPDRIRKSIGAENTFETNLSAATEMMRELEKIIRKVVKRLQKGNVAGKTVTLKIKYHDFQINTRSKTFPHYIKSENEIRKIVQQLLHEPAFPEKPVRLLGVTLSKLNTEKKAQPRYYQMTLEF